jgi:DNA polymerase-3 subunit alpha
MGIEVLPPAVDESGWSFTAVGEAIRFGLGGVKGVGESAVEAVMEARSRVGSFRSLAHFATEVDLRALNSKVFEALIKSGSFDGLGAERSALLAVLERVLDYAQQRRREVAEGQGTLFGGGGRPEPQPDPRVEPWSERERLAYEKETLGLYLTGNPLSEYQAQLMSLATATSSSLQPDEENRVTVGGVVTQVRQRKIKSGPNAGRVMGRFILEDLEGSLPVAVFANQFQQYGALLEEGAIVLVTGLARDRGSGVELTTEEVVSLEQAEESLVREVEVHLGQGIGATDMVRLRDLLTEHAGDVPVRFSIDLSGRTVRVAPAERFRVRYDATLVASLEDLLGKSSVRPA